MNFLVTKWYINIFTVILKIAVGIQGITEGFLEIIYDPVLTEGHTSKVLVPLVLPSTKVPQNVLGQCSELEHQWEGWSIHVCISGMMEAC